VPFRPSCRESSQKKSSLFTAKETRQLSMATISNVGMTPMSIGMSKVGDNSSGDVTTNYSPTQNDEGCYECALSCYGEMCGFLGTICCCMCPPYVKIEQGTVGIVKRYGKFVRTVNPGLNRYIPFVETITPIDTRLITMPLDRQSVITQDNISVDIDVILTYRITNIEIATFKVQDLYGLIRQCAYSTIRSIFGKRKLQEILEKRVEIAAEVQEMVEHDATSWGVHINSMNIKDVMLPDSMVAAISAAPVAQRNAEAKIILAKADVESAKLMREAADILASESAMQIRYLEHISKLASSNNTKIVFFPASNQTMPSLNTVETLNKL